MLSYAMLCYAMLCYAMLLVHHNTSLSTCCLIYTRLSLHSISVFYSNSKVDLNSTSWPLVSPGHNCPTLPYYGHSFVFLRASPGAGRWQLTLKGRSLTCAQPQHVVMTTTCDHMTYRQCNNTKTLVNSDITLCLYSCQCDMHCDIIVQFHEARYLLNTDTVQLCSVNLRQVND